MRHAARLFKVQDVTIVSVDVFKYDNLQVLITISLVAGFCEAFPFEAFFQKYLVSNLFSSSYLFDKWLSSFSAFHERK